MRPVDAAARMGTSSAAARGAYAGTSLLQAIFQAGGKLVSECGGCHVFVTEGRKGLTRLTPAENAKLDTLVGIGSKSRLACQATFTGTEAVTVELGALSG